MHETTYHDDLVVGGEYLMTYHVGGGPDSGTVAKEVRNPGIFLGFVPCKEAEPLRCLCCHYKASLGSYDFLDPRSGSTFHFCPRCISNNTSQYRLKNHIVEDMEDIWVEFAYEQRMEFLKTLAGTLTDMMAWYKVEPELRDEIRAKFNL